MFVHGDTWHLTNQVVEHRTVGQPESRCVIDQGVAFVKHLKPCGSHGYLAQILLLDASQLKRIVQSPRIIYGLLYREGLPGILISIHSGMKQIGACLLGKLYDEVGSSPALAISLAQSYFDGVLYDDAVRCEQRYTGICEWCL